MLVLRLALGGSAHAISHEPFDDVADRSAAHCADHADTDTDVDPEADCCERGACECPCLYVSCVLAPSMHSVGSERALTTHLLGVAHERPATLLRPPA